MSFPADVVALLVLGVLFVAGGIGSPSLALGIIGGVLLVAGIALSLRPAPTPEQLEAAPMKGVKLTPARYLMLFRNRG